MAGPRLQHAAMNVPPGSQEKARAFYGGILGLEEKFRPDPNPPDGTDRRHLCLVVDDLEDYRRRLTEAGATITSAEPIPNRPRFFCRDPFGNLLEFTTIQGDYRMAQ